MHFTDARDELTVKYNWSRRVATLAVRLARGIDTLEILVACVGFRGTPIITRDEWTWIKGRLPEIRALLNVK